VNQSIPLREQLKQLEQLQEIDLKIDSIRKQEKGLPGGLKGVEDSLKKLQFGLDQKKTDAADLEKTVRQAQAALELNQDRMTRSHARLEGVQNSQEFQAVTKEQEQLKKLNVSLEEQIQKAQADQALNQKEQAVLDGELQKLKEQLERDQAKVASQLSRHQTDLTALLEARQGFVSKIDRPTLAQYERVRGARGGVGIVPTVAGRCQGCHMMIPPQLFNELHRCNQVHACPSCHRILFLPVSSAS
jgi:predicted  nucleic acid-binding Zn-ribbon protein